jgi:hypothetical protein
MFLLKMINIRSLLMPRVENPEVMVDIVGLPLRSLLMPRVENLSCRHTSEARHKYVENQSNSSIQKEPVIQRFADSFICDIY